MYLPYKNGNSSKILIYFHANAEDLGLCYNFADELRKILRINVIVPEYPGYSIYKDIIA